MAALDVFLRDTLTAAQAKFPDVGIMLVSVENAPDGEEAHEITMMTNMQADEVEDVLAELPNSDDEIVLPGELVH